VTATARTIRGGRRLFVLSVDVFDEANVIVVTAVTTYIKIDSNSRKD
jgi:acyl-coenzyme A thioesterase PaaI-like protein